MVIKLGLRLFFDDEGPHRELDYLIKGRELHAVGVAVGCLGVELDPLSPVFAPVVAAERPVRAAAVDVEVTAVSHGARRRPQKRDSQSLTHMF